MDKGWRLLGILLLIALFEGAARAATSGSALDDLTSLNVMPANVTLPVSTAPGALSFSMAQLTGAMIFGAIGLAAFVYGKKNHSWKPMAIGVALMGFPYVVASTLWTYVIGTGLCLILFFWRDY